MEVGFVAYPVLPITGRGRVATVRDTQDLQPCARLRSATLTNNTGAALYAVLLNTALPEDTVELKDMDVFAIIGAEDAQSPSPFWSQESGRDIPNAVLGIWFTDSIAATAKRSVNDVDLSASDVPSFLDVIYDA